jgi:prenyltransferase beta subunit
MKRLTLAALFLLVLVPGLRAQSEAGKETTVAWLQGLQAADGGFLQASANPADNRMSKSSLRSTSSALRALKYFGGKPRDLSAAAAFVEKCFDKTTGGFADRPGGKPDVATTAIGIMAVVEVKRSTEPYAGAVIKYLDDNVKSFEDIRIAVAGLEALGKTGSRTDAWLKEVARLRHEDGSYGEADGVARDTGGATVVLLRLGAEVPQRANVIKTIRAGQREDGGWGKAGEKRSDLESSYRVMRCFHMLKERPDSVDKLKAFIARCRNKDGGYGTSPGQESTVSGTYFAGIILHWLDEK